MRKRLILFAAICCSALACAGAAASTAGATGPGNGATVIRDSGPCLTGDSTNSWFFDCRFQIVIQPGGTLTEYLTGPVIIEGSSPLPSHAVTDISGPCLVLNGVVFTSIVSGVVTPSGQVKLTCKGQVPS
jgi:hypothetical protein